MNTDPHRTFKGRRMAGRMGAERVTVRNMKVAGIAKENNLILINAARPNGGYVMVRQTNKFPQKAVAR